MYWIVLLLGANISAIEPPHEVGRDSGHQASTVHPLAARVDFVDEFEEAQIMRDAGMLPPPLPLRAQTPAERPPPSDDVTVVRCPPEWKPQGPHCVTTVEALPYTECPEDKERFWAGYGTPLTVSAAGICSTDQTMGPVMSCLPGYTLVESPVPFDDDESGAAPRSLTGKAHDLTPEDPRYFRCEGFQVIPKAFLEDSGTCPSNFDEEPEGCRQKQLVQPIVGCPSGWELVFQRTDPFSFRARQHAFCRRSLLFKGRLWCPQHFHVYGEPMPHLPFGAAISLAASMDFEGTDTGYGGENLIEPGTLGTECVEVAAAFHDQCDEFECDTQEIRKIRQILKDWAYYRLETDPNVAVHFGLPNGNDIRYTPRTVGHVF